MPFDIIDIISKYAMSETICDGKLKTYYLPVITHV